MEYDDTLFGLALLTLVIASLTNQNVELEPMFVMLRIPILFGSFLLLVSCIVDIGRKRRDC